MFRFIPLVLCLFMASCAMAQKNRPVVLKWKIKPADTLVYRTAMEQIDSASFQFDIGLPPDSKGDSMMRRTFEELQKAQDNYRYISKLSTTGNGVIDVTMIGQPDDSAAPKTGSSQGELQKMMQTLSKGVLLRGSVYASGGIHSFWLVNRQKNLLALLFELPSRPVRAGDIWSLDVNLISNDHNFTCDSSFRKNQVKLTSVDVIRNDTVAVLRYEIEEFVRGQFAPAFAKNPIATTMHLTHYAEAKFSVTQGKWISYEGIAGQDATGMMIAHQLMKMSLVQQ